MRDAGAGDPSERGAAATEAPTDRGEAIDGDAEEEARRFDDDRIEAGAPTAENALFVLLGALATLFVIARIAGLV